MVTPADKTGPASPPPESPSPKAKHRLTSFFEQKVETPESVARSNIRIMAKKGASPLSHLRVEVVSIKKAPTYVIKVNNVFQRTFFAIRDAFRGSKERKDQVAKAMRQTAKVLSNLPTKAYLFGEDEGSDLFNSLQQYNKVAKANQKEYLHTIALRMEVKGARGPVRGQLNAELMAAGAEETTRSALVARLAPNPKGGHRRYPGDTADHGAEAARIFLSTQLERFAATLVGGVTDTFNYFRGGFTEQDVRTDMQPTRVGAKNPSSYWVGHSTCLISVPLESQGPNPKTKTFHVLTDPVEGDLNPLLYPRKTKVGRTLEECPAIDAMCLSHNHLDHYSAPTLKKLLAMQPHMIVPEGDGHLFTKLGFTHVIEQNWGDTAALKFSTEDGKKYQMEITAVPSRHWAGQGPMGGASSAFVGHVIHGFKGGDIYYAGDTARLDDAHLEEMAKRFDIRWMYQPGGPDERRADMRSTHQASADSLLMTAKLLLPKQLAKMQEGGKEVSREAFCAACKQNLKTLLMHTSTFKLGNLHADDTVQSITRVVNALRGRLATDTGLIIPLEEYEAEVLNELRDFCETITFSDGSALSAPELADILAEVVYVPKIGSRIDFERDKASQSERVQPYKRDFDRSRAMAFERKLQQAAKKAEKAIRR